jgi:hypothetical protein
MKKVARNVIIIAVVALLCTAALYALSYVRASGHVHSKTSTTLKIQRPDGSKVNADCMVSDAIRHQCNIATPGDPAEGFAECISGWCSWIELDVTLIGG